MPRIKGVYAKKLPSDFDALYRMLPTAAIHDEVGYENAQEMIDALTCIPKRTRGQKEYLETLTILFAAYEDEHHAIDTSDITPVDALRHLMEAHDMTASDLGRILGDRTIGSKILSGQRELSKSQIRKLADHFGVSPALFL